MTVSGQIPQKFYNVESLEAYLHMHIFFDTVAALVQCENTQNVGAVDWSKPCDRDRQTDRQTETEKEVVRLFCMVEL